MSNYEFLPNCLILSKDVLGKEATEENISDYLSNTFNYCHHGFSYVVEGNLIYIKSIY